MKQVAFICALISLLTSCANDTPNMYIQNPQFDSAGIDSIIRDDQERRMHLLQSTTLLFPEVQDDLTIIFLQTEVAGAQQMAIDTLKEAVRIFPREEWSKLGVPDSALSVCGAENEMAGALYYITASDQGIALYTNMLTVKNTTKHDWIFVKEFRFW